MKKAFRLGLIIGRFQHLHDGHQKMIDTALTTCDRVLLLVGSSQESYTRRNPFNLKTRMDLIRDVYSYHIDKGHLLLGHIDDMTNEDDISAEWGKYVLNKVDMWRRHYDIGEKIDVMLYGNDEGRAEWFNPKDIDGVSLMILSRQSYHISATEMRRYLIDGAEMEWCSYTDIRMHDRFEQLREELLDVPYYKELAEK